MVGSSDLQAVGFWCWLEHATTLCVEEWLASSKQSRQISPPIFIPSGTSGSLAVDYKLIKYNTFSERTHSVGVSTVS